MNKTAIIISTVAAILFASNGDSHAQSSLPSILSSVEDNNVELRALRGEADAAKAEVRAESSLPDPEVSFGYLWYGRKDVSVSQALDWALLTGRRRAAVTAADSLAEATYAVGRQTVLRQARVAYADVVYGNQLVNLLSVRLDAARRMEQVMRQRLAAGDARQTEVGDAALACARAMAALSRAQSDLDAALAELKSLNGGIELAVNDTVYSEDASLPADFTSWFAAIMPQIREFDVARSESRLACAQSSALRAQNIPQLTVGYMGEFTPDEHYEGVTIGLSIPLWSAGRRAKQARATEKAAQDRAAASYLLMRSRLETAHSHALMLGRIAAEQREALELNDNRALNMRALEDGLLTVAQAITSDDLYYSAATEAIEAEHEYQRALAQLMVD